MKFALCDVRSWPTQAWALSARGDETSLPLQAAFIEAWSAVAYETLLAMFLWANKGYPDLPGNLPASVHRESVRCLARAVFVETAGVMVVSEGKANVERVAPEVHIRVSERLLGGGLYLAPGVLAREHCEACLLQHLAERGRGEPAGVALSWFARAPLPFCPAGGAHAETLRTLLARLKSRPVGRRAATGIGAPLPGGDAPGDVPTAEVHINPAALGLFTPGPAVAAVVTVFFLHTWLVPRPCGEAPMRQAAGAEREEIESVQIGAVEIDKPSVETNVGAVPPQPPPPRPETAPTAPPPPPAPAPDQPSPEPPPPRPSAHAGPDENLSSEPPPPRHAPGTRTPVDDAALPPPSPRHPAPAATGGEAVGRSVATGTTQAELGRTAPDRLAQQVLINLRRVGSARCTAGGVELSIGAGLMVGGRSPRVGDEPILRQALRTTECGGKND
ncbi:MAG: hypothetical protein QM820_29495 [Minicystis sp.]